MVKLNYKGNLSDDIKDANLRYSFFKSNKSMILLDFVLSLGAFIVGYKLTHEDISMYALAFKTFFVCASITALKGIIEKIQVKNRREKAIRKLNNFSKFLNSRGVNISGNDLKNVKVSNALIVEHSEVLDDNVVNYKLNRDKKKRMLVYMKNELALSIAKFRVMPSLIEQKGADNDEKERSDYGLYLVDSVYLPTINNADVKSLKLKK